MHSSPRCSTVRTRNASLPLQMSWTGLAVSMYPRELMRQRHAQMFLTHRHQVDPWPELVQSTDQSFHHLWLLIAALIIATV